jgi:aryl-alcohol dehydrogenase-like predicted oxidoreductase
MRRYQREGIGMERRRLGRTEHRSSVLIYGGAALSDSTQEAADQSIQLALDAGINHFDTAESYGASELRLGAWMPQIRDRIFLATKTDDRTATGAYDAIRRSLERLQTDRVDLIQLHAVCDVEDLGRATAPDGAVRGAVRARDEGLVSWIGITGHGMQAPATHLEALRRFPFDTVLTPCNYRLWNERAYRHDLEALEDEIAAQDAGLLFIKALARNLWREGEQHLRTTWYEPLESQEHTDAAVAFALSDHVVTGIATAGDVRLVPRLVEAERRASSTTRAEAEAVLRGVDEFESPFVRVPGRKVPDWLESVVADA